MNAIADLLDNSVNHEAVPDTVDPRLRLGAWVGLALLVLQGAVVSVGRDATDGFAEWPVVNWAFTGFGHPGPVLAVTATIVFAGLLLAAASRGFTRAARVGQAGQLGLLGAGAVAAVPVIWIVLVVAAVVAAMVALVVAALALLAAILGAMA